MLSMKIDKPQFKENSKALRVIVLILAILSAIIILMPVVVCFMSKFTLTPDTGDNIYYVLRGMFAIALIFASVIVLIKKDISYTVVPSGIGFAMLLFPLYDIVQSFTGALSRAKAFSMSVDYSSYLIQIAMYLIFAVLCVLTFLYSIGKFRFGIIIMVISVISCLFSAFIAVERYITYLIPLYEVVCFSYSSIVSLIPFLLVISTIAKSKESKEKYIPKRMK